MSEASGSPGRYQRSSSGMVGALLMSLLVVGAYVGFRACTRTDLQVEPDHVDYLAQVAFAQQAGDHVVYPASLPTGWYATQITVDSGKPTDLQLSLLTGDQQYVGFVQSPDSAPALLTRYVDPTPTSRDAVDIASAVDGSVTHWDVWTDSGGDTALVARQRGETLLVFGTASQSELEQLTGTLTAAAVHS